MNENYSAIFIEKVKEAFERKEITYRQLADDVGCTEVTLSRILNHNRPAKLDMAARMAKTLGLSIDCICGIEADGHSDDAGAKGGNEDA